MKSILEISAATNDLKSHFDVLSCFLHSATTLHAAACDGIASNEKNFIGTVTDDLWNKHFITAFFLFRHTIEIAIKALIKEINNFDAHGHNIKRLWEENIPNHQNVLPDEINKAFSVLEKYHILENAQLFRYHVDKGGVTLRSMQPIKSEDFDALSSVAWAIRHTILECTHARKGLPVK